jgi:hypothetical protein
MQCTDLAGVAVSAEGLCIRISAGSLVSLRFLRVS